MKRSDISYEDKLNELRLDILHPNSRGVSFILLEGDTDVRLFRKLFNMDKCKVENVPGGNGKLEDCVEILIGMYNLVLGIRDADFLRLKTEEYHKVNMFLTDFHDIEMTILNFETVLNSVVFEYSTIRHENHLNFRDSLIKTISSIGFLKFLNDKENLKLSFTSGFIDLISFGNRTLDFELYLDRVLAKSPNAVIKDKRILIEKIEELKSRSLNLLQITNGHDLLNTFAKYFREVEQKTGLSGEMVESALRIAFTKELFEQTSLFAELRKWQNNNSVELF